MLVLILNCFALSAQFYQAELILTNGYSKEGLAKLPQGYDSDIRFKSDDKSKVEIIRGEDINQIIYTTENGANFLFERNKVIFMLKPIFLLNANKLYNWMVLIHENPALGYYLGGNRYKIHKNNPDNIIITDPIRFLKKNRDPNAYNINGEMLDNNRALKKFFEEYPDFVQRINDKEFRNSHLDIIIDAFYETY